MHQTKSSKTPGKKSHSVFFYIYPTIFQAPFLHSSVCNAVSNVVCEDCFHTTYEVSLFGALSFFKVVAPLQAYHSTFVILFNVFETKHKIIYKKDKTINTIPLKLNSYKCLLNGAYTGTLMLHQVLPQSPRPTRDKLQSQKCFTLIYFIN